MMDPLIHGLFGGLFGPAIAAWMSRFRYWIIFLFAVFATYASVFAIGVKERGITGIIEIIRSRGFVLEDIYVPVAIGLLAVLVAFLGSFAAPKKDSGNNGEDA